MTSVANNDHKRISNARARLGRGSGTERLGEDAGTQDVADLRGVGLDERHGARFQARDIPTVIGSGAEIAVLDGGFRMRSDVFGVDCDAIGNRGTRGRAAQRVDPGVVDGIRSEILGCRVRHRTEGDAECERVSAGDVRTVADDARRTNVAGIRARIAREHGAVDAVRVAGDADMVCRVGRRAVSRRPMEVDRPQVGCGEIDHSGTARRDAEGREMEPIEDAPQPVESPPEYATRPVATPDWRRRVGGPLVGLGLVGLKFKAFFLALLNFKWAFIAAKYGLTAFSFVASIWFYTLFFGFKFALVFVLLIAVHEAGHAIFVRGFGIAVPAIYFIPGLGAMTTWSGKTSVVQESVIAFGGPLLGGLASAVCFGYGIATHEPFWLACAYTGFFLNLFNMVPLAMLDGGRMTAAISPFFWIFGVVAIVAAALAFHWWSPVLLLVLVLSVPQAIAAYRGKVDPRYYQVGGRERALISIAYFALLGGLLAGLVAAHVPVGAAT